MEVRGILEYIKDLLGEDFPFPFMRQFIAVGVEHERRVNCGEFGVAFRQSQLAVSIGVDDFSSGLHNPSLFLSSLNNINSRGVIHYCFTGLLGSGGSSASGGRLIGLLLDGREFLLEDIVKKIHAIHSFMLGS